MFNPQNYKKMKTEIAERIKKFVEEIEDTNNYYKLVYKDEGFAAWRNEDHMYIFVTKNKMYREKINIYPIFSFNEIKEALTQF